MRNGVTVGIPASLSGQFRVQGRQALAGIQAWAEDVNRAGGLTVAPSQPGIPVMVVHYDDASQPGRVREIIRRLDCRRPGGPADGAVFQRAGPGPRRKSPKNTGRCCGTRVGPPTASTDAGTPTWWAS